MSNVHAIPLPTYYVQGLALCCIMYTYNVSEPPHAKRRGGGCFSLTALEELGFVGAANDCPP